MIYVVTLYYIYPASGFPYWVSLTEVYQMVFYGLAFFLSFCISIILCCIISLTYLSRLTPTELLAVVSDGLRRLGRRRLDATTRLGNDEVLTTDDNYSGVDGTCYTKAEDDEKLSGRSLSEIAQE